MRQSFNIIVYLLCLEGTEGQSHDLGLSVAERTIACDGLAAGCKLGRLTCVWSYRWTDRAGSASIVSELKPPPHLGHPVSNQGNGV